MSLEITIATEAEKSGIRTSLGIGYGVKVTKANGSCTSYVPTADTDTARFVAWTAAHTALLTGETIETPPGDYYITTNFINLKSATYIFNGSRFYTNASTAAGGGGAYANWTFWATDLAALTIRGPWIIDGGSVSGKVGMVIQKCLGTNISEIWFKNFPGSGGTTGVGLYVAGDSSTKTPAKSATNLRMTACGTGMRTDSGTEYWTFTNIHIESCTSWGIINTGGNNLFLGCHLTNNGIGFELTGNLAGNSGHGSFVGGTINHSVSKGLKVNSGFALGFEFVGSQFFANGSGGIDLGGAGVHFTACEIDSVVTCSVAQEGLHVFRGCLMPQSNATLTTLTAPQRANIKFYGCKTLTGDYPSNNPEAPPVYTVAALPAAAAATYGTCAVSDATTPVVGSTVAGSGAVKALVTSNGTTWTVTAIP